MKRFAWLLTGCVAALGVSLVVAGELKSGLQPGAAVGAFNVVKCAGAVGDGVDLGTELCYRCRYGGQPMVMVFSRDTGDAAVSLVKSLDEVLAKHSDKRLRAFVNLLGTDRGALEDAAKEVGAKSKSAAVPVVVPVEFENGPEDYGLNPEAGTTVLLVKKGTVQSSLAFPGALDDETVKKIVADVPKLVE